MNTPKLSESLKKTLPRFTYALKASALPILGIILAHFINYAFILPDLEPLQAGATPEVLLEILPLLTLFLLIYLTIYLIVILLVGFHNIEHKHKSFFSFIKLNFFPLITDLTRAFNYILLFTLFFILPGVYKYFKLALVPYAVMEPKTEGPKKKMDSLKISSQLTANKKVFLTLLCILILSIPFDFISLAAMQSYTYTNVFIMAVFNGLFPILYHCLLFSVYAHAKRELRAKKEALVP